MTRTKLRKRDLACLGRLRNGPLEIGAIPGETVERLTARGLVVQVLGSCEITPTGQLTCHRQQFLRAPRSGVARVTRNNPLYLQEARHGANLRSSRLRGILAVRRRLDAHIRQATELPHWLMQLASETAGQFRPIHEISDTLSDGRTYGENKAD